jgi:hypothetical protein
MMIEAETGCSMNSIEFTRKSNDVNGNPRYVCHFLALDKHGYESNLSISQRYALAVKIANSIGGRKYHTKNYGGGIVFQSYSLDSLVRDINSVTGKKYKTYNVSR